MTEPRELALITEGARMLAEARDLFSVRDVRSVAIAAVAYARAKDLGEDAIRSANRIVILATARIGEEIIAGQERGEIATAELGVNQHSGEGVSGEDTLPATLGYLGISRNLSSTGQRLARQPEAVRQYLDTAADPTLAGAVRAADAPAHPPPDRHRAALALPTEDGPFGRIVDDTIRDLDYVSRAANLPISPAKVEHARRLAAAFEDWRQDWLPDMASQLQEVSG
ncbi:MAG: hypothetical protein H0V50_02815 [Thermoleophilaceae bacterium]|nr:hypothetical protein [Thermoleophilaceae bacterium]